jgi:hypothetical protein
MDNLAENLYPLTDEDVEILWESHGISVEELEELKLDEQEKTHTNSTAGQLPSSV